MKRRDLFRGMLMLAAGALFPKPLLRAHGVDDLNLTLSGRTRQGIVNGNLDQLALTANDIYVRRKLDIVDEPCIEFPCETHVMVTERWTRHGEHSYRIEDGPWIPIPQAHPAPPWIFFDSPICSVQRTHWLHPDDAARLAAQTSARKYITFICPCGANNLNPCSHLLQLADTDTLELTDVLKR